MAPKSRFRLANGASLLSLREPEGFVAIFLQRLEIASLRSQWQFLYRDSGGATAKMSMTP